MSDILYQGFIYLKSQNKFYEDFSIAKGLARPKLFRFSEIVEIQAESDSLTEKVVSNGTEISESIPISWRPPKHAQKCIKQDNSSFSDFKYN